MLAEAGGRLIGFVDFGVCRDEDVAPGLVGELFAIYVRPDCWGRGVGLALMHEARTRLQRDGFGEVVLWVIEGNRRAIGFYERLGFVRDGLVHHREMYRVPKAVVAAPLCAGVEPGKPDAAPDLGCV